MIPKRTVLILGAGASSHLGYPIGSDLVSQICERLVSNQYDNEIADNFDDVKIGDFGRRLSLSGCDSIDGFLEYNDDCMEIGCMFIADCLKQHELAANLHPNNAGWYRYLFNVIATKSLEELTTTPITIVTFNYDRSLEAYMHQCIANRYNINKKRAVDILQGMRIIHLHGILGEYPDIPYNVDTYGSLASISSKIRIIHQISDRAEGFCSPAFEAANQALHESEKIIFLGFGFNEDNIRRLKFFSEESVLEREVISTSYGLQEATHNALLRRLAPYGIGRRHFSIYTHQGCDEFFKCVATLD